MTCPAYVIAFPLSTNVAVQNPLVMSSLEGAGDFLDISCRAAILQRSIAHQIEQALALDESHRVVVERRTARSLARHLSDLENRYEIVVLQGGCGMSFGRETTQRVSASFGRHHVELVIANHFEGNDPVG
jgi:predicted methyltransferase MtxX (methanogen marker protein 4)